MHASTLFRQLRQDLPKVGAKIPAALQTAWDNTGTFSVPDLSTDPAEVAAAAVDALANGRDLDTDPALTQLITRRALATLGVPALVERHTETLRGDLIRQHADAILAELTTAFDAAAADIEVARASISSLDLTTEGGVHGVASEKMTTWGQAYAAARRIEKIVLLWSLLGSFTHSVNIVIGYRALITSDLPATDLAKLPGERRELEPIYAGHPLSLASFDEYAERCARVRKEWDDQARREREARKVPFRTR
ncbi:hypothetical protein ACFYVD_10490 [Rhodococcus pyridinivorans]|uniref:hypothetical protein n=1 Tax=Rhodococcus pyridinivorans TaxID=103816 RepID=UPI0036BAB165